MNSQHNLHTPSQRSISPGFASFLIVFAELLGTSLWFSINSVADNLMSTWDINLAGIGLLTNAVQLGFVAGTLIFAFGGIADRFRPSRIFSICALLGALFNGLFALYADSILLGSVLRFLVGVCLAGIYPIGMKLIITWDPEKASQRLAQLVGMLILGTALPHATRYFGVDWPWQLVILFSSILALLAMIMIFWLGDGPHLKMTGQSNIKPISIRSIFTIPRYRSSAFGYFGHMWEVYAFWAMVPMLVAVTHQISNPTDLSGFAFVVIAMGAVGCFIGGQLSKTISSSRVASYALGLSGLCCLIYPWVKEAPLLLQLLFWAIWGMSAAADSPQLSAISAKACPPEIVGTALTIQNAIGFGITMISIQLCTVLIPYLNNYISWVLLPGPVIGLIVLNRIKQSK
ncbi:AraJ Arabinose efflux permease [Burkholderiaceae bacterium]